MNLGAVGSAARQQYYDTSAAVAKNSVDPNKLIQESMKARSMQKKAAMDAESAVRQTKENIRGEMAIVQRDIDIDKTRMDLKKNLRKAGLVAAAGAVAGKALIKQPDPPKPYESDFGAMTSYIEKMKGRVAEAEQDIAEHDAKGPKPVKRYNLSDYMDTDKTGTEQTGTEQTPGTLTPSSSGPSRFSAETIKGLSEIRRVESGPYGYNAYNLGGRTEFDPVGSGDASKDNKFGKPLTEMTIGEIKKLGAEGRIHATGAYQFTHNTGSFGEAAQMAGLKDTDLFTPANQDMMAYQFGRTYDWSRWSGLKRDSAARDAAIAGFNSPLLQEPAPVKKNSGGIASVPFVSGNTGSSTGPHTDFRVYSKKKGGYLDDPGAYLGLISTADGRKLTDFAMTSGPGMRTHPTKGGQKYHYGYDYATPSGTTLNVQGRFVERKYEPGGGGYYNIYQHPTDDDLELVLMHGQKLGKD